MRFRTEINLQQLSAPIRSALPPASRGHVIKHRVLSVLCGQHVRSLGDGIRYAFVMPGIRPLLERLDRAELVSALPRVIEVKQGDQNWHFIASAGDIRLRTTMRAFRVRKTEDGYIGPRHVD